MNTNLFRKDVGTKGQGILQHSGHYGNLLKNNLAGWLGSQHTVINEQSLLLNYHLASKHTVHFNHLVLHHGNQ
jgi:hypothetical protein